MHFHLPKPMHGWREFAGEVGIILIGVLLALLGEALFEDWNWHRKIDAATDAMNHEIAAAVIHTVELDRSSKCSDVQLDYLEARLLAKDWDSVRKIPHAYLSRHYYSEDAYTSAVASQVAQHLTQAQLQAYGGIYTQIRKIRQHQEDGWTTDAVFRMLSVPGLPKSETMQLMELSAATKLRDSLAQMREQGDQLRSNAKDELGIQVQSADHARMESFKDFLKRCEAAAAVVKTQAPH